MFCETALADVKTLSSLKTTDVPILRGEFLHVSRTPLKDVLEGLSVTAA